MLHRKIRWALIAIGTLLLLGGGSSIFIRPAHEVHYRPVLTAPACVTGACYPMYRLHIGNTGTEAIEDVRVSLRKAHLSRAVLAPQFKNFGVVSRAVKVEEEEDARTYSLGRLRPGDRVEISFTMMVDRGESVVPWQDILLRVESSEGEVREGDPAGILFGRVMFRIFSAF